MEPAILVLGAISDMDGAFNMISYHLPNLVPFLMEVLKNNSELIRATTIWTLSKFTDWIARDPALLDEYLKVLCQRMIDHNQYVQMYSCHAFTEMIEIMQQDKIIPLIIDPLNTFKLVIE